MSTYKMRFVGNHPDRIKRLSQMDLFSSTNTKRLKVRGRVKKAMATSYRKRNESRS